MEHYSIIKNAQSIIRHKDIQDKLVGSQVTHDYVLQKIINTYLSQNLEYIFF